MNPAKKTAGRKKSARFNDEVQRPEEAIKRERKVRVLTMSVCGRMKQ